MALLKLAIMTVLSRKRCGGEEVSPCMKTFAEFAPVFNQNPRDHEECHRYETEKPIICELAGIKVAILAELLLGQ